MGRPLVAAVLAGLVALAAGGAVQLAASHAPPITSWVASAPRASLPHRSTGATTPTRRPATGPLPSGANLAIPEQTAAVPPSPGDEPTGIPPSAADSADSADSAVPPTTPVPDWSPITAVRIARLGLDAGVVPARVIDVPGGTTWEVPAFKVGHGELSAGAGAPGNAVLLGHLTSPDAGNVFRDLRLARIGDLIEVVGEQHIFTYAVTDVRSVPRFDLSPLQPTETASLTLITCSGLWLPAARDYSERLIVHAELSHPPAG